MIHVHHAFIKWTKSQYGWWNIGTIDINDLEPQCHNSIKREGFIVVGRLVEKIFEPIDGTIRYDEDKRAYLLYFSTTIGDRIRLRVYV